MELDCSTPNSFRCSRDNTLDGTLFVADTDNHTIRKVTLDGTATTLCGFASTESTKRANRTGWQNGKGSAARFDGPSGIAISADGTLFVTDRYNCTIRKVTA